MRVARIDGVGYPRVLFLLGLPGEEMRNGVRVGLFGVAVCKFNAVYVELPPVAVARIGSVGSKDGNARGILGEYQRSVGPKRRLNTIHEEPVEGVGPGLAIVHVESQISYRCAKRLRLGELIEIEPGLFVHHVTHAALDKGRPDSVQMTPAVGTVRQCCVPHGGVRHGGNFGSEGFEQVGEECLGDGDRVAVIGVHGVVLEHGELGVVVGSDLLTVSETAGNFKDTARAFSEQALVPHLRRRNQKQRNGGAVGIDELGGKHLEVGLGNQAGRQPGGVDLKVATPVEECANLACQQGSESHHRVIDHVREHTKTVRPSLYLRDGYTFAMTDFDTVIERRGTGAVKWDVTASDVIPLWVADMDFAAPAAVTEALARRVAHPVYGYPMVNDSYRHAFCEWQRRRNALAVDPAWLLATPAVMPAVRAAIDAVSEPGDAVVVQTPVYFPFFHAIRSKQRRLVLNPLREAGGYTMDLDHLESLFRDGARVLLLCSPHNPVARLWSRDELTALAQCARRWGVTVISDEIHSDIILESSPFVSMLEVLPERTVACFSVSKTFNLAGIGASQTVVPDAQLRARVRRVCERDGLLSLQHVLSLTATEAAYQHGDRWLDALLDYLRGNHELLRTAVADRMPGVHAGLQEATYIAWLDLRSYRAERGLSESQLKRLLLNEARVKLSDGVQFGHGGLGFQRLNFATPRVILEQALDRIADALHRGYISTI